MRIFTVVENRPKPQDFSLLIASSEPNGNRISHRHHAKLVSKSDKMEIYYVSFSHEVITLLCSRLEFFSSVDVKDIRV